MVGCLLLLLLRLLLLPCWWLLLAALHRWLGCATGLIAGLQLAGLGVTLTRKVPPI